MTPRKMMTLRLGLALLMAGTALGAAGAQTGFPVVRENPGDALTRHLRTIADQPRNVAALTGAARAALQLGDPQAALTFFARAEEIAPRDGRIKAGMAAAFVQMEQVHAALKFFQDAASMGVPEAEFAGDRGLAHDLNGDPRRAQADYNLSLRRQEDAEVRRRLALSHAISGERDKALATIDAQLRAHDRAAWRVRSFVLALTGDAAEATKSAEATMPAYAAQMRPFFAALPSLGPAERAMAVHFGHFPNDGRTFAAATQYASATPQQAPQQAVPAAAQPAQQNALPQRTARSEPVSTAPRRRPEERAERYDPWRERFGSRSRPRPKEEKRTPQKPVVLADARAATAAPGTALSAARPVQQPPAAQVQTQAPVTTQRPPAAVTQPVVNRLAQSTASLSSTDPQQFGSSAPPVNVGAQPQASQPVVTAQLQPVQPAASAAIPLQQPATVATTTQAQPNATVPVTTSAAGSASMGQGVVPGFSLQPSPQAQTPASATVRLSELTPSAVSPEAPTSAAPAAANQTSLGSAQAEPQEPARAGGLAAIAATIQSLPSEAPPKAPANELAANTVTKPAYGPRFETKPAEPKATAAKKPEPEKKAAVKEEVATKPASKLAKKEEPKAAAKKETSKSAAKKEEPAKKEPSRHWVQIAGGANEAAMTREFLRLKAKAPKLLAAQTAWTTPLRATNRLLVGPFKSAGEAQDFVNELAKLDLAAFSWTSPAGQEIAKLTSK